ncbi:MAG: nuclear transport factor 2 family protein [Congregibacter sp.]|nr:nuclear transport factor 2 family protein [Congregibacter sp.]MDP5069636.1 nuclear transport factor 2 family protein [Congregibacter sp.]
MNDLQDVVRRLDELESRVAIRDLASDYCHGFDKRNFERFLAIWWEDCVWNIGPPFGSFSGHDGVRQALHDVLWPAWDQTQHITSNNVITFIDADHAQSICDVDCTGLLAGSPEATFVGASYRDRLERRNGQWRIAVRDVEIHYFNTFAGTELSKPETQ